MRRLLIALVILLAGCGALTGDHHAARDANPALPGLSGTGKPSADTTMAQPSMAELETRLIEELQRLGTDPSKTPSLTAGAGNAVFDLRAAVARTTQAGDSVIELRWTERLVGDYNMDGLVGVSDLTPLGAHFNETLEYRQPSAVSAIEWYPLGDPDNDGVPDTGDANPADVAQGSDTARWRLARIDGDFNGAVNINDVTPIAYHYGEVLAGYRVYRLDPGGTEAEPVLNPDTNEPVLITRAETLYYEPAVRAPNPNRAVRYTFEDTIAGDGEYQYFVRPYTAETDETGPQSNAAFADTRMRAVFDVDQTQGTVALTVAFDASASFSPNGIAEYAWDYDGSGLWASTGTSPNSTYNYNIAGNYAPQLRITDINGAEAIGILDSPIEVWPTLRGQLQANPDQGDGPLSVHFTIINLPEPVELSDVLWDFNGNGVYGDLPQEVDNRGLLSGVYTYADTGAYLARAQIFDTHGRDLVLFHQIAVGMHPPVAALTADVTHGVPPLTVNFDATASTDVDGGIRLVYWDFDGDGTFDSGLDSSSLTATHQYTTPGVYNATVQVTDIDWLTDEATLQITVNNPPVAGLVADPPSGTSPLTVSLDASSSTDSDGTVVAYEFDFGEGGGWEPSQSSPTSTHVYGDGSPFPGREYVALVRVTDNLHDSSTAEVTIPVINSPPVPWLTASPQIGYSPMTVEFGGANSIDLDGHVTGLEFDFDEGYGWIPTGIYPYANHTYANGGPSPDGTIYNARLRVTDDDGATAILSLPIHVLNTPPTAALSSDITEGTVPFVVIFDAGASSDIDGFVNKFEFQAEGDPSAWVDNGGNALYVYSYQNAGTFVASVRATDDDGETGAASIAQVTIIANPAT